jgi:DNA-binding NarL/FixJ family response regulator
MDNRHRALLQLESLRLFAADRLAERSAGQADEPARLAKRGLRLSPERFEVQQIALGTLPTATSPPAAKSASSWLTLSKAEKEVAMLAAAGWPNSAIGVRRGTATRTTDAQISSIFQKLMITSREDIVRFVPPDLRNQVSAEHSHIPHQAGTNHDPFIPARRADTDVEVGRRR